MSEPTTERIAYLRGVADRWDRGRASTDEVAGVMDGLPRLLDAVEARATAPAGLDAEDVRAVLAAWGMEANVTFSRDIYERGEEAVKRLRAALAASGENR